jgi:hypothetical protein
LSDGTHKIHGRSIDRGGNESTNPGQEPTYVSYVIDRTPPPPPTLILPLNDMAAQTRGHKFKWSKVTDADRYLFQIADDAAFNNVLNHQVNASYSGLLGQVTIMTEASFSVPKDGTYYWRVASIETCEDGFNISGFSTVWRVIIDTVKPRVLEVQPTPSTGNKITTGMVTFTIRFSEKMDVTVPLTVSLTSAGGQLMLIEQLTFVENTWTGTTVIPKNSSALYDGIGVVAISGGKDPAGNEMESDSTNTVVINTGPSFETKIFSNPAHEYEIIIVTRSSEALQAPPTCSVTQSSVRVPVPMNFLKERYYAGSYRIDPDMPGKAYIDITGTDLHGMIGKGSVEFAVADLNPDARIALESTSGNATLKAAPGSVAKASTLFVLDRQDLDSPFSEQAMAAVRSSFKAGVMPSGSGNNELVPVLALDEIGPANLKLTRRLQYTAKVGNLSLNVPAEKVHVYRRAGNNWVFCGGGLKDGLITAELAGLGRLALLADLKAPEVVRLSPRDNEKLEEPQTVFSGQFGDAGAGIDPASVRLSIDGVDMPNVKVETDGSFEWTPPRPLAKGKHRIEVRAADRAGNEALSSFLVTAPGPFGIDQFAVYPNPVRGAAVWFTYNFEQRADELRLRIYDVAGHKVADFDTADFANLLSGKIRWDLCNRDGKQVANGVYLYKLEAVKNGRTVKTSGKLAVLR